MRRLAPLAVPLALVAGVVLLGAGPASAEWPTEPFPPVLGGRALGGPGVVVGAGATPLPAVAADAWVVADGVTGRVLAAKNAHARRAPASTLKILTALTLLPRLDPTATYVAVDADARAEGSRAGLVPGSSYTVDQLFTGLFLPSGNDAASALAHLAGGPAATVAAMNEQARRLQALDTTVVNTSGLDAPGQLSSAYDLTLVARAGLARPDFRRYAALRRASFPGASPSPATAKRTSYQIQSQNRLLTLGYPGVIGVKTGYTTGAGRTFVGAAERGGRLVVVTLLRIAEPTDQAAAKLIEWGFANLDRDGVGRLVDPVDAVGSASSPTPPPSPVASPTAVGSSTAGPSVSARPAWAPVGLAAVALGLTGFGLHRRSRRARRVRRLGRVG